MKPTRLLMTAGFIVLGLSSFRCTDAPPALNNPYDPLAADYVPPPPTGLVATPVSDTLTHLTWVDNSSREDGFIVERSFQGQPFLMIGKTGADTASFDDHGPHVTDAAYVYRVAATLGARVSQFSDTASANLSFPAPEGFAVQSIQDSSVRVEWGTLSPLAVTVQVERAITGGDFNPIGSAPAQAGYFDDHSAATAYQYQYRIRAMGLQNFSPYTSPISVRWLPDSLRVLTSANSPIPAGMRASADGRYIATWGAGYTDIRDVSSWSLRAHFTLENVGEALPSPDGTCMAIWYNGGVGSQLPGRLDMFQIPDSSFDWQATDTSMFLGAAWTPDGQQVITSQANGYVRFWSRASGQKMKEFHPGPNWAVQSVSQDGRFILLTEYGGPGAMLMDAATGAVRVTIHESAQISSTAVTPAADRVVLCSVAGAEVRDGQTGALIQRLDIPSGQIVDRVMTGGSANLVVGTTTTGRILVWEGGTYELVLSHQQSTGTAMVSELFMNGSLLAVAEGSSLSLLGLSYRWSVR